MEVKTLAVADRTFHRNGTMYYSNSSDSEHFTSWVAEFFGNTITVNGKVWPKMSLKHQKYRFIFLNACQARFLNIYFLNKGNKLPFDLIRTEGDYLTNPVRLTEYLISVGARV